MPKQETRDPAFLHRELQFSRGREVQLPHLADNGRKALAFERLFHRPEGIFLPLQVDKDDAMRIYPECFQRRREHRPRRGDPEAHSAPAHQRPQQGAYKPARRRNILFRRAEQFMHLSRRENASRKSIRHGPQAHIDRHPRGRRPEPLQGQYLFLQLAQNIPLVGRHG